jgi:hypothetical protein
MSAMVFIAALASLVLVSEASSSSVACGADRATSAVVTSIFRTGQPENLTPVYQAVGSSGTLLATPAPRPSYAGAKRGLAYNEPSLCKLFGDHYGFRYNWAQVEDEETAKFIPMMHSPVQLGAAEWLANVDRAVARGSQAVMGFNECDHAEQCNLSPEGACSAWKQYMNPIKTKYPNVTIIGPSVTNGPAPMGLAWLSRFDAICPDADIDAYNIHFYDIYGPSTVERLKSHVEQAATYGKKVWVTEFGLNPGAALEQARSFLEECIAYLEDCDDVQGYSWFMVGTGENQLNLGAGLSTLGHIYASGL